MEGHKGDDSQAEFASRVKARLTNINKSASAFTKALGLPPEAKDKVISRMALGERSVPVTLDKVDMPQSSAKQTDVPQESTDDPASTK